ncbi:MAG TPA: Gfo/Idh/MocA family oxidoreductase [Tepidisphaeraceae bacterium]|nr:Gfo/Idh/MocA family oxidoreductase [Tepidisphaeraceae bacterium]
MSQKKTTRRKFLKTAAATGAGAYGFWISGRQTWADELASRSANEKVNVACIGIGGKGDSDSSQAALYANIVAICDVDEQRLARKAAQFPKAKKFTDFRKLFDAMGREIDAATISTPDHTHAVATMMAIKLGKGVYTQKPLAHDVWEARQLRLAAKAHKVASQMGNQGTSTDRLREGVEVIRAGAIGPVREVHVWTDRPTNWWPQSPDIRTRPPEAPVPEYLHWNEWLGTAPARPYAKKYYHPHNWRGWWDFGSGALGDMGCHTANLPFMALGLAHPTSIQAQSETPNPETYPAWAKITYQFPARGQQPPVTLTWYEGHKDGQLVQPPQELISKVVSEYNKALKARNDKRVANGKTAPLAIGGSIMVGDKGILYSPVDDGRQWELLPADAYRDYKMPPPTLPRNPELHGDNNKMDEAHKAEWLAAVKGGPPALSNFNYAGLLAETILLGNVAIRAGGEKLEWDATNLRFPNAPQADKWLRRRYREPWTL